MDIITLILLLSGAIVLALAALQVGGRINLLALGLLLWILVPLIHAIDAIK